MSPELTPEQRIRAAAAHYGDGIAQHLIAALLGVNQGRINEACQAILLAAKDPVGTIEKLK